MSRMNGQLTWVTPIAGTPTVPTADDLNSTNTSRTFLATERVTVVEVGVCAILSTAPLLDALVFTVSLRQAGIVANDTVISVWTSAFAAEGGVAGDPSTLNFNEANKIASGLISPATTSVAAGSCLRAFTETSLEKGDMLVFKVTTANGSAAYGAFYAKAYPMGAGLIEKNDIDPA